MEKIRILVASLRRLLKAGKLELNKLIEMRDNGDITAEEFKYIQE